MPSTKTPFTYHPDRNRILDKKRFSRRTTTVRPITFFKNWDSNLNTPESSQKQKSPLKDSVYVPASQKDADENLPTKETGGENIVLNETPDFSHVPREKTSRSPILTVISRELSNRGHPQITPVTGPRTSPKTKPVTNSSKATKPSHRPHSEPGLQTEKSLQGEDSDNDPYNEVNQRRRSDVENTKSVSQKETVVANIDHEGPEDAFSIEDEMDISEKHAGKTSLGQPAIVSYLQNAGLHVSVVENEAANQVEVRAIGLRDHVSVGSLMGQQREPERRVSVDKDTGELGSGRDDEEHSVQRVGEDTTTDMEEIDITHKIPLAQSTAIGVEIEQETEEEEEPSHIAANEKTEGAEPSHKNTGPLNKSARELITQSSVNQTVKPMKQKKRSLLSRTIQQQAEKSLGHTTTLHDTPPRSSKRKLVTSTPKPDYCEKRKRVSIGRALSVQQVSVHQDSVQHVDIHKDSVQLGKKNPLVTEQTPDLRKAMLLSYAKTPSGVTPSYLVKTPRSGPTVRQPRKKRPSIVPVPEDLVLNSTQTVEAVDLWQGNIEGRRRLADATDLDIVLQTFERLIWHYRENIEEPSIRKAITLFAKKTQTDLRDMVCKCQHLKNMKTSFARSQSIINKKRVQLLNLQKEHSRMKASVAGVRLDLEKIEGRAQRQTDVLDFTKQMQAARREQASKDGRPKLIGAVMTTENTGLSEKNLTEAQKVLARTMKSFKLKPKS